MFFIPYNKDLKEFSRQLRNHSTTGEILLWMHLRAGSIKGYNFNRQRPIGRYIVDFYCKSLKLVIEVDGGYHFEEEQRIKDEERQRMLETFGLNFLRFHEEQVRKDMNDVIQAIENYIVAFENLKSKV
jgi:very-short-patch-repair endonuclease